ncbi:ubiquinone anaerobic biosynthesis accessory factor UbiT [Rhizobium hidalgonense]|uniref:ubiquinone anaerobic biosynthesis accessory factor UbiT n=1 Tax=Rhizobium hidalgonense TaxID=1538159 RepID=UPI0028729CFC|nr:SCP2 sterol-binding domain-containing protein [Rhizobium hidalgonense]MDR9804672.1 SCP2 sterol-binding domain-containing protein [Rhizobium hidalgonense]
MLAPHRLTVAARLVPLPIAARVAALLFGQVLKVHSTLFDRLGEYQGVRFGFVPSDLPFAFAIRPVERTIRTFRTEAMPAADATISGPLLLMLALAEGRVDGDAIFFARKLTVTGDMEAVLALRNALDDSGIDMVETIGTLAGPMRHSLTGILSSMRRDVLKSHGVAWN